MAHIKTSIIALAIIWLCSCKHHIEIAGLEESNYPDDVGRIMLTRCAVSGCHNNSSYTAAANLNLTTWNDLYKGANSGSVVIPFRSDFSTLCFFTNTDTSLGIALQPTMPVNQQPLSKADYLVLKNWIDAGGQDKAGRLMYEDNATRKKLYVINRMCDIVTVFDAASFLQMRYVDVGFSGNKEFPYSIKIAPDRKAWYVSFFVQADGVQRFDGFADKQVGKLELGTGSWHSFEITPDSKRGYFADNSEQGRLACADLENLQLLNSFTFDGELRYPSGIALTHNKLYIGCNSGNYIHIVNLIDTGHPTLIRQPVDGSNIIIKESSANPSEILCNVATARCYLACTGTSQIKVLDMNTDKVISTIQLSSPPSMMAKAGNMLLVSCPDDSISFSTTRGSVIAIDLTTNTVKQKINSGYQPYGIAIDEANNMAYIANANIGEHGPASHHTSKCGGKNGNVTMLDLNTLQIVQGKKREVAVFPCSMAIN
jgi:YVTN family beta-propeller protein